MQMIPTSLIYPSERARPLVGGNVSRIAESIKELGLLNPLIVKPSRRFHGGVERDVFDIIAGTHRFEAVRQIGWTEVACKVIDSTDDLIVELTEIDENLCRVNLTAAQEASAMARRKHIYEELHPETKHGETNRHNPRVADSATLRFSASTAAAVGKSERAVQAAITRGKRLGADLEMVVGTSLDKQEELDALGKLPSSERETLIARARAGERVSAIQGRLPERVNAPSRKLTKVAADPLEDTQASEKQVARLMDAWNAAGPDARQEFLSRIDAPIMDRRFA